MSWRSAGLLASAVLLSGCQSMAAASSPAGSSLTRPSSSSTTNADEAGGGVRVTVTATIDGDTFRADVDGKQERIRVLGINAPEVRHGSSPEQCGGEAARTALDRMIWRHTVTLSTDPGSARVDQYGRLLRYVTLDGRDVGLAMIQQGRASEYHPRSVPAESRARTYSAAQRAAEHAHRGQWAACTRAQEVKQ